jgi:methylenetetrahydrofolate reductase (NADPH)
MTGEKRFSPTPGGYRYASELVEGIRKYQGSAGYRRQRSEEKRSPNRSGMTDGYEMTDRYFCIGVGGYPEKHFEAANIETDIAHLKKKIDAGADYVITQMFFDNRVYYDFVRRCREAGITVPIIPGLKPLSTARQVNMLPESFSLDIPVELTSEIAKAGEDKEAIYQIGTEWCIGQCKDLIAHGVPAVHFYTMGKSKNIVNILKECF